MQAASRESYAAALERLNAYAARAQADNVEATGGEILSVATLLRREPRLRRALSDPSRSGEQRAALLTSVIGGKVGDAAAELVGLVVGSRATTGNELLDTIERVGVETLLAAADRGGDLAEVEDELFRFGQVVDGDPALSGALSDVVAPPEQRASLAAALLDGKAKSITVRLVEAALGGFGGRSFPIGLTRLVELAAERRERQVAYVTVASPLSDADESRLGGKLSELYGREVSIKQTVDPRVLGGVSVLVGSDLYDGTVLRRLNDTRNALTKS
jgi:F-type H+-transporting ATPase subunit delta